MTIRKITAVLLALIILIGCMPVVMTANGGVNGYYNVNYLEDYAAAAKTETGFGATWTPTATTFKVWSPTASMVQVRLYATGSDDEVGAGIFGTYSMTEDAQTGIWSLTLDGNLKNVYYTYLVTARGETKETRDIYAKASGVNGRRSMIVDLDSTDPAGWGSDAHVLNAEATDAVIWEIHVRDFSISSSSGVSEDNRGKYLAFTENGTTLNGEPGEISTCVKYLVEQGVNTVHLLPVFDFGSVDETVTNDPTNRNWGYDPVNYNVPEGSYSSDPYDGNVRIREFKQMVQALHAAGISVVMDVVYNHTYDLDNLQWGRVLINNAFNDTVPGYYYRLSSPTSWYNGSGCGNVTASDKAMFGKYMVDSVYYWATEYHIDGFRFDLMACHDVDTMNAIRAKLDTLENGEKILMYGEPWTGGDAGIANGCTQDNAQNYGLNTRIGLFCDWMRDAIKGDSDGTEWGWVQGATSNSKFGNLTDTIWGGLNANDGRLTARSQTVTYADAHDNLILWDKLIKSNGGSSESAYTTYSGDLADKCMKQLRLAETILMVSQGMQFQVGGTEFARNKKGDHNSYNASDSINAIDWNLRKTNKVSADYYKGLIAIRKAFSPISDPTVQYTKNALDGADANFIAYWIPNGTQGEWSKLAVLLNSSGGGKTAILPDGEWTVLSDGTEASAAGLRSASGTYTVPAYTGVILAQGTNPVSANAVVQQPVLYANGGDTLYANLDSVDWWKNDGAVTRAYVFNGNNQNAWSDPFTQENGSIYRTTLPAGNWTHVILVRINPGYTGTDYWATEAKWNQTGNIPLDAEKNYITSFADGSTLATWDTYSSGSGGNNHFHADNKVILHCWNWSYDTIRENLHYIKNAGFTAVQTSPAQPPKGYDPAYDMGSWWMLYQPLGFAIAPSDQTWLGGVTELKALCDAARQEDIEVIVDVVCNHIGNGWDDLYADRIAKGYSEAEARAYANELCSTVPAEALETYNPELWNDGNYSLYFRDYVDCTDDTTVGTVRGNIGMPDLKTEETTVQTAVINYLKALIDCGVSGFRFDAAKHIETPTDGIYASDFWPNVLTAAKEYGYTKGIDLWCYGEILYQAAYTRKMSQYTAYLDVTDINYAGGLIYGFGQNHDAYEIAGLQYKDWNGPDQEDLYAEDIVVFAETHDMYADSTNSTSRFSVADVNKAWATATARQQVSTVYLARPEGYANGTVLGEFGECLTTDWMSAEVAAVNKFHQDYIGTPEDVHAEGSFVVIQRFERKNGVVIVNADGTSADVDISLYIDYSGTFYDQITGNLFTVQNGRVTGQMGDTGIAVLTPEQPVFCEHPNDERITVTTPATCTEPEWTEIRCGECGQLVSRTQTSPALGHIDANSDRNCDRCGERLVQTEVYFIDALDWVSNHGSVDFLRNVNWYAFGTEGESAAWPGVPAEYVGRTKTGYGIWKAEVNPSEYQYIKFVGHPGESGSEVKTVNLNLSVDLATDDYIVYTAQSTMQNGEYTVTGSFYFLEDDCMHSAYTVVREGSTEKKVCTLCGMTLPSATYSLASPITSVSLTLVDDICVNFYTRLIGIKQADAKVILTWNASDPSTMRTETIELKDLTATSTGLFKIQAHTAAKEMNDAIQIELYDGDQLVDVRSYAVRDYANAIRADTTHTDYSQELYDLTGAMLVYGSKAQALFGHHEDALADGGMNAEDKTLVPLSQSEEDGLGHIQIDNSVLNERFGITFNSYSLVLEDRITLRLYFQVNDSTKFNALHVTRGGTELEHQVSGSLIYYDIRDTAAKDILNDISVVFAAQGETSLNATFNIGEYIRSALDGNYSQELKDVVTALYRYSKAATAYFATTGN